MKQNDEKSSESRMLEIGTSGSMRGRWRTVFGLVPVNPCHLPTLHREIKPTFFLLLFVGAATALLAIPMDGVGEEPITSPLRASARTSVDARAGEGDDEAASETARSTESRSYTTRGAASADSSSDAARGTASGLAEEGEDESSLTLDHFRTALAQNPTATRFVIVEEEEGGISIQPRVAATSRLALKRNQADNETIIDALRELLVTRHGGSSEIVASFFDGESSSGDMPLSAVHLGEILRRSDTALEKSISSKKAPQKTPPPSASENEATSALDDSNVDESLGADIRGHLHTIEKITLAENLSKKSDKAVSDFKKGY